MPTSRDSARSSIANRDARRCNRSIVTISSGNAAGLQPRRVFSLNDESGVLTCAYPRSRPNTAISFAEETMSSFENQIAGHMIQEGLVDEGLVVVAAIRARYDARSAIRGTR